MKKGAELWTGLNKRKASTNQNREEESAERKVTMKQLCVKWSRELGKEAAEAAKTRQKRRREKRAEKKREQEKEKEENNKREKNKREKKNQREKKTGEGSKTEKERG